MKTKSLLSLTLAAACLAFGSACANIDVARQHIDPQTGQVLTDHARTTFFCAKGQAEKIELLTQTKTTSKLLGAKNAESSGDVQMAQTLFDGFGTLAAAFARSYSGMPPAMNGGFVPTASAAPPQRVVQITPEQLQQLRAVAATNAPAISSRPAVPGGAAKLARPSSPKPAQKSKADPGPISPLEK